MSICHLPPNWSMVVSFHGVDFLPKGVSHTLMFTRGNTRVFLLVIILKFTWNSESIRGKDVPKTLDGIQFHAWNLQMDGSILFSHLLYGTAFGSTDADWRSEAEGARWTSQFCQLSKKRTCFRGPGHGGSEQPLHEHLWNISGTSPRQEPKWRTWQK